MELSGAEVAFVGTRGMVGANTGLADVGVATMTECLTIAGWVAQRCAFQLLSMVMPVMGHCGRAPADCESRSGGPGRHPY